MRGDALARGARSATFGPAKISQAKWDAIWETESSIPGELPAEQVTDGKPTQPESDNHHGSPSAGV
jgi:hypothetical protein